MTSPKVKAHHKDIEIFAYFCKEKSIPFLMTDWSNRFMPLLLASSTDCEYKNITIQIEWILKNCIHKSCHSKREFLLFPFILIHKGRVYYYPYYLQIDIEMKFTEMVNSPNRRKRKQNVRETSGMQYLLCYYLKQILHGHINFYITCPYELWKVSNCQFFSPILVKTNFGFPPFYPSAFNPRAIFTNT